MKGCLLSLLFTFSIMLGFAQYGGNSLGMGAVDYVEIADSPDGTLDINAGFTFEAWIFNFAGTANQKVGGKLAGDFKNGFIYGIEDSKVNMEVFDDNGLNTKFKAGYISDIGWTHVAGTYEVGGMLRIYVNGVKVGETAASSATHGFNTNPFRIGIAPWDVNALGFSGYVDEVKYWTVPLDEATIKAWMHKNVTSDHPNYANLSFYLKCDEAAGPELSDSSGNNNFATFSATSGLVLEAFFLPFKGDFGLFENDVEGVWNAKPTGSSDILTVEGQFFDTLEIGQTVILSHSDGDYSLIPGGPSGIDQYLSKAWRVTTQGDFFVIMNFDFSPINISPLTVGVSLLSSEDPDFSDADMIDGNIDWNNHLFTVTDEVFQDGYYYTLGFPLETATNELANSAFDFNISPNPSNGAFTLDFEKPMGELSASFYDLQGRVIYRTKLAANQLHHQLDLGETLKKGTYCLKLTDEDGQVVSKKVMVE